MLAIILFIAVMLATCVRTEARSQSIRIDTPGVCFECRYDLSGLSASTPCPECGAPQTEHTRTMKWTAFELAEPQLRWSLWMLPLLVLYLVTMHAAAERLVIASYQAQGYGIQVARHVATRNELELMSTDAILWPIAVAVGISPGLGLLKRRGMAVVALSVGLILALIMVALIWTVPYLW
jgi:hypothetical protein